eukprot:gene1252-4461_t
MAKSIRSKVKRKFRSVKRQKILAKKISALQAETVKEEMNVQPDTVDGNESLPVITSKSSEESTSQDNASHSSPNSHESKEVTISNVCLGSTVCVCKYFIRSSELNI